MNTINRNSHFLSKDFITEVASKVSANPFWVVEDDGSITIPERNVVLPIYFHHTLPSMGFRIINRSGSYLPIQVRDNRVRDVGDEEVKNFIRRVITALPDGAAILDKMVMHYGWFFNEKNATTFRYLEDASFLKDTRGCAYRFFENGVIKVAKNKPVELLSYGDFDENLLIWEGQVIRRSIDLKLVQSYNQEEFLSDNTNQVGNHFYRWTQNLCKSQEEDNQWVFNQKTFKALASGFGYLQHRFWADEKIVCFVDEIIVDDRAEGRTGKSVVMNDALSNLLDTCVVDAKDMSKAKSNTSNASFVFNFVSPATQYIAIDDCAEDFDFNALFSKVTGPLTVNRKYGGMFQFPKKDKPKMGLSTNHPIEGDGFSYTDRQHLVSVGTYYQYHKKELGKSPAELHGCYLFDEDWGSKNWEEFDAISINFLQYYLDNGLVGGGYTDKYRVSKLNQSVGSSELVDALNRLLQENVGQTIFQKKVEGMDAISASRCLKEYVESCTGETYTTNKLSKDLHKVATHYGYKINVGQGDRPQKRFGPGGGKGVNSYLITTDANPFPPKEDTNTVPEKDFSSLFD